MFRVDAVCLHQYAEGFPAPLGHAPMEFLDAMPLDDLPDALRQDLIVARLHLLSDVIVNTRHEGSLCYLLAAVPCVQDDGDAARLPDLAGEFDAVQARHRVVGDHTVVILFAQEAQRFEWRLDRFDF